MLAIRPAGIHICVHTEEHTFRCFRRHNNYRIPLGMQTMTTEARKITTHPFFSKLRWIPVRRCLLVTLPTVELAHALPHTNGTQPDVARRGIQICMWWVFGEKSTDYVRPVNDCSDNQERDVGMKEGVTVTERISTLVAVPASRRFH